MHSRSSISIRFLVLLRQTDCHDDDEEVEEAEVEDEVDSNMRAEAGGSALHLAT